MTNLNIILMLLFAMLGTSYTWGMRGTILGGEKGAMLPGAFLGFTLAYFSQSEFLASNAWMLAGVGAAAMSLGGNMTYGETLHLSMATPPPNVKKGLAGVFVKGIAWFGIFGGFVSFFISAISGFYSVEEIIRFFILLPFFAILFFFVFNKPYNKEKSIFPKVYFSITRRETWGGLLGIMIHIIVFSAIHKDYSALVMTLGSSLSGGVGWVIGQLLQMYTKNPTKKGKLLFVKANDKNLLDAWKIMECVLGSVGGIGCTLTFFLSRNLFADKFTQLDTSSTVSFISDKTAYILFCVYAAIILIDSMQHFVKPSNTKLYKIYDMMCEESIIAIYGIIPITMCCFGVYQVAATASYTVLINVLGRKMIDKFVKNGQGSIRNKLGLLYPTVLLIILQLVTNKPFKVTGMMFMYTFAYEIVYYGFIKTFPKDSMSKAHNKAVHGYFIFCCIAVCILMIII